MNIFGWVLFGSLVCIILGLDLFVFRKRDHPVTMKESLLWSGIWVAVALLFNVYVYFSLGKIAAINFLSGYLIEKSLSVDNLFVFILIFSAFSTPISSQHRVLFFGIIGALVARGVLIFLGIVLIQKFHWVIYLFGLFLIATGIKVGIKKKTEVHPEKNPLLRLVRKYFPMTPEYREDRFFVGKMATPLFLVLIAIETTDLLFALDSIPAILAITRDPFIVYTSNIFALLGLRALYFVLEGSMKLFQYLHYGIALILVIIGCKMLLSEVIEIHPLVPFLTIIVILSGTIGLSLLRKRST